MSEEMDQFLDQKDEEPQEVRPLGSELYEWLQMLMGCVLAAVLLFTCLGRLTRVDGESMNNTLQHGEMMLVWSLGYQPQQGDIVVVNKTTAEFLGGKAIVKRVIATGGQTVDIDYGAPVRSMWTGWLWTSPISESLWGCPIPPPPTTPREFRPTGRCLRALSL